MKTLLCVLCIGLLAGCSTVQFDNGSDVGSEEVTRVHQWHHSFGYELFEGSAPINPNEACASGWASVSYDNTLMPWFTTGAFLPFFGLGALGNGFWTPRLITFGCLAET